MPLRYIHHKALKFAKCRSEPPLPAEVADALCASGAPAQDVWRAVDDACAQAEKTAKILGQLKIWSINFWSLYYPNSLRSLAQPPWALFYQGKLPQSSILTLGVVGTRYPDEYGVNVIHSILPNLKTRPLQIVSGLAYGIDALAHYNACEAKIPNFAVMGCGLDQIYPPEHCELAFRILECGGGLLSELPPETPPLPMHFPRRNRIISGLSHVIWIPQGTAKSGSFHTAKHALEQGKTVVTTPGDVFNALSDIPHRLLKDGAAVILNAKDLDFQLEDCRANVTH